MRWPCAAVRRTAFAISRSWIFLHLVRRGLRQIGDDLDAFRPILFRDLVLRHQRLHASQIERLAGTQHHKCAGAFAQPRVRISDDRRRKHGGMLEQQVLDIEDRHVLAAADDDVLDAAVDADVALVVHVGHVAGVEPTLGVERLHVLALVVAEAHLRAAHLEQPFSPTGAGDPSMRSTFTATPSSGRPSVFEDFSSARSGSVNVLDSDPVMPHSEQTLRSSSR